MSANKLFSSYKLGKIELKNRIVMSPMTRSRAIGNIPNDLIAQYYAQRASAGLIITEGTSPSPNGLGYARIPGIFSKHQVEGWKKVTSAVHEKGGKIFVQLMHTGRIGHEKNLPAGAKILAPSAVKAAGQIWTDAAGMQEHPTPQAKTAEELQHAKKEFVHAAKNAIEAGFDGIELHGANGYLLEQFLSPHSNVRTDEYGGSVENRTRFAIELAREISEAIGKEKVGIRLSPYGAASDMKPYPEVDETYSYLAKELGKIGIAYIHVVDHSALGAPHVPSSIKHSIREQFGGTIILAGGYNKEKAEADLQNGNGDLIGFGRPFINNPDFVTRLKNNLPLSTNLDTTTFYAGGEKGYVDYPVYEQETITA
ncbi:MAG TPA: alkene reductase [Puia sp.]|nr:alkene reductase [Puia sp.]